MSMVEYMYKLLYGRRLTPGSDKQESSAIHGDLLRWRLSRVLRHHARNSPHHGLLPLYSGGSTIAQPDLSSDTRATGFYTDLVSGGHQRHHSGPESDHGLQGEAGGVSDDVKPSCMFMACDRGRRSSSMSGDACCTEDIKFSHSAQFLVGQNHPPTSYFDSQSSWLCDEAAMSSASVVCYCCSLDGQTALQCNASAETVYPDPSASPPACWSDCYTHLNAVDCWPRRHLAPSTGDVAAAALFCSVNGFDLGPPPQTGAPGGVGPGREAGVRTVRKTPGASAAGTLGHNLQCAVCGDNAACQHYGVRTCEGCKGFFKRTVQKNSKYVCLSGRSCIIDKRRRNRCQFCRFQKCLSVGMVKEVVRRDTLKGRRGRLPSKPKSVQQQRGVVGGLLSLVSPPLPPPSRSPPVSTITAMVRAHVDSTPDLPSLDYSQYAEVDVTRDPDVSVQHSRRLCYTLFERCLDIVHQWAGAVPRFNELSVRDQQLLFRASLLEVFTLRLADRMKSDEAAVTLCDGTVLHRSQCEVGLGHAWTMSVVKLSRSLRRPPSVDLSSVASLAALTLITDRAGLQDPARVDSVQSSLLTALKNHCTSRHGHNSAVMVGRLLAYLVELRSVGQHAAETLTFKLQTASDATEVSVLTRIVSVIDDRAALR